MRFYLLLSIYLCLCITTVILSITTSATETSVRPRGIKKIDIPLYTATTFSCRSDPSIIIPISHINDDYCDCADGSDEPGTSACDNGRFWCKNVGWRGELVKASRVNDGICDCCDGSDEWAGLISCPNTCIELGKAQGEDQLAKIQKMEAGAAKRAELITEAERVAAERKAKKEKYEARLVEKAAILEEVKQKKEAAEAIEAEEKRIADEAQAVKDAEEARIAAEKAEAEAAAAAAEALANPPVEDAVTETSPDTPASDAVPVPEPIPVEVEVPSSGIAGVGMAGIGMAGVGHKPIEPVESFPYPAEYAYNPNAETKPTEPDPVLKEAANDDDYNDEEEPATPTPTEPTRTEAQQAADAARSQFNEIESSHRKTQDKLEKVKKLIENDYGVNREFTMLEGQCYQIVIRQYTYEVCPYDESRQIEGSSHTSLGRYSGWHDRVIDPLAPADKQHVYGRIMEFTGGQSCWNGPQRSANIEFECGEDTAVLTVDEPSRCVYAMRMSTPAVCQPDEIAALRIKIEEQLKLTAESEE